MATTYGKKKKRAIFPSFSSLQGENTATQQKLENLPIRVPAMISLASFRSGNGKRTALGNDDSIDEMANMLLDDSTDNHKYEEYTDSSLSTKYTKHLRTSSHPTKARTPEATKALPQLPRFLFNGDDAWASRNASVVTAAGRTNTIDFSNLESESSNMSSQHTENSKTSPPPIPKRSSKRKSLQFKKTTSLHYDNGEISANPARRITKKSISAPTLLDAPRSSSAAPVDHVARILEANRAHAASKAAEKEQLEGSLVPAKKRRVIDGKVFDKMKTVISKQLRGNMAKETDCHSTKSLLEYSTNHLHAFEEDLTALDSQDEWQLSPRSDSLPQPPLKILENKRSDLLMRHQRPDLSPSRKLSEGAKFHDGKVKVTDHRKIARKALPIDRANDRNSRLSIEDPIQRLNSSALARTSTKLSIEHNEMSDGSFESRCDLPAADITSSKGSQDDAHNKLSMDGLNFDTILSSSPLAQSTPRVRLEPMSEDYGKTTLKQAADDSASVFAHGDSNDFLHMEVDEMMDVSSDASKVDKQQHRKKKAFSLIVSNKDLDEMKVISTKKHPSPTRSMWDDLGKGQVAPYFQLSGDDSIRAPPMIGGMLKSKVSNQGTIEKRRLIQKNPDMIKSVKSLSKILDTKGFRSTSDPKSKRNGLFPKRVFSSNDVEDEDLDELQWE